ncbi:MAG TPA: beta-ketoacyl synthase N-terminal-like domain-containing protein, partial [Candidatus Polarisedimenticolia bacterium]|nr:beta-ketoacyl synthase N-terminal-like domain-containing protein [Candidatus Polarisedimenticolia bacterium]
MNDRVVITGCGAVGPFGSSVESLVGAIRSGRSAVERTERACAARVRGPVDPGPVRANVWRRLDRSSRMAVAAARQALRDAGLGTPDGLSGTGNAAASGIALGTMTAGVKTLCDFLAPTLREGPEGASPMLFPFTVPNAPASQCSILLGLEGPNLTISEMEASGLAAIATAAGLVGDGVCDVMVAGGVDEWLDEYDRAWARMRLTHRGDPAAFPGPFGRERRGFVPGEGAYAVVLESLERAVRRGARARAEIAGEAMAHASGPAHAWPSQAEVMTEAIARATSRARLRPEEIGYVAAGANGSRALDAVEARAISKALGRAARRVPVTSVKGAVGESGSASACAVLVA